MEKNCVERKNWNKINSISDASWKYSLWTANVNVLWKNFDFFLEFSVLPFMMHEKTTPKCGKHSAFFGLVNAFLVHFFHPFSTNFNLFLLTAVGKPIFFIFGLPRSHSNLFSLEIAASRCAIHMENVFIAWFCFSGFFPSCAYWSRLSESDKITLFNEWQKTSEILPLNFCLVFRFLFFVQRKSISGNWSPSATENQEKNPWKCRLYRTAESQIVFSRKLKIDLFRSLMKMDCTEFAISRFFRGTIATHFMCADSADRLFFVCDFFFLFSRLSFVSFCWCSFDSVIKFIFVSNVQWTFTVFNS